jgi:signal peptidase I
VFNYPDGDTVILEHQNQSYYAIMRQIKADLSDRYGYYEGMEYEVAKQQYRIVARPVDKRENYIKRCVAIPGDTLQIKNAVLYINGEKAYLPTKQQFRYGVKFEQFDVNEKNRKRLDVNEEDHGYLRDSVNYAIYHLNKEQAAKLESFPNILSVKADIKDADYYDSDIFPHDKRFPWNVDNFGPIVVS